MEPGSTAKLAAPDPAVMRVAQFHEPHFEVPVVPSVAPPVQPQVFAPIALPPDSQAIKTGTPTSGTTTRPTTTSTPVAATSPKPAADPTIEGLQDYLTQLGYDPGPVDGLIGNRTWDAIFTWIANIEDPDFQQDVRDAAHDRQFELLIEYAYVANESGAGAIAKADPAPAPAAPAAETKRAAIQSLQQTLGKLGFDSGPADGIAGNMTVNAVRNWIDGVPDGQTREQAVAALEEGDYAALNDIIDQSGKDSDDNAPAAEQQEVAEEPAVVEQQEAPAEPAVAANEPVVEERPEAAEFQVALNEIMSGPLDEAAREQVHAVYNASYSAIVKYYREKWGETWGTFWSPSGRIASSKMRYNFYSSVLNDGSERSEKRTKELVSLISRYKAQLEEAEAVAARLNALADTHNSAIKQINSAIEESRQPVQPVQVVAERDFSEGVEGAQANVDYFIESGKQAEAELKSLQARTDLSAEEKARVSKDITARIEANKVFLADAMEKLAAEGGSFDGYDGKDFADFDPYAINQTDIELQKIAETAKAQEQFYDELSRAREAINTSAEGLDAAQLHDKVTALSERVTEGAESYKEVANLLHEYGTDIHVTRKQGELEYAQAMAEDAVLTAERNLAYAQSVVQTTKNAEAVLALGGMGYGLATGGLGAMAVVGAQSQAVMATLDGATTAIDGFSREGFVEGLKEGGLQAGKYYLPVNTYLAVRDGNTDKTTLALAIVGDAANLFSNVQTLKTAVGKVRAVQAKITQMTLSESDRAISNAAKAAQQNGDDLVRSYQNAKFEVETAMRSGSGANVSAAQDKLDDVVRLIDSSDEAKLALKTRSTLVQAEFVDDQARIIKKPAQAIWEQKMKEMGWSDAGLETAQIRNQSSAGTVGLDDDIRLLEPSLIDKLDDGTPKYTGPTDPNYIADTRAFKARLVKNGETQSLTAWEHDAQQAMEEAYKETAGYSARDGARVEMTTSASDEAFKDVRVLQEGGVNQTSAGWSEQSASVTQVKMRNGIEYANQLGLGDGPATGALTGTALQKATTEIKVATRELLKDLTGKALKARPGFEMPAKIDTQVKILQGVVDGTYDPAVANSLLKRQTGTSLAKTMETLGGHFEALLKFN